MNQKRSATIAIPVIIIAVLIIGGAYWYLHGLTERRVSQNSLPTPTNQEVVSATSSVNSGPINLVISGTSTEQLDGYYQNSFGTIPTQTDQTSTASMATSSVVTTATSTSTPTSSTPQIFTSSSSAQVGDFTVVTNCKAVSIDGLASVGEINILKGSSTLQTILTTGIAPGGSVCPKPESKDINSDGYPDFMIPYNYGNAATDFEYWLYNSSTNQFSCPNVQPSGKPWAACSLDESN